MPTGILDQLQASARRAPQAPALLHGEQLISHAQLQSLVSAAALGLSRQGLRAGETLGLCMRQTPLHLISLLALLRLGILVVPIGTSLPPAERAQRARQYGIGRVLTDHDDGGIPGVPGFKLEGLRAQAMESDAALGAPPAPDTPGRLALTSGTIGEPKAVLHSHAQLLRRALRTIDGMEAPLRLLPPRLHLTVATMACLGVLCQGGALVFAQGETFEDLIAAARRHAVAQLILSPAAALTLARRLPVRGLPDLRELRLVGGAATSQQLQLLRERCAPRVCVTYALTELGLVALDGRVRDSVRLEVVDERGQAVPPGEIGELRIRAEPMPAAYHLDPDLSRERFRDGWFHTGDLGSVSPEGLLRIEGRNDELLNFGGHKLLPRVLEERLLEHPQVRQAAIFPMAGPEGGDHLAVALVPAEDADPAALAEACRDMLGLRDQRRILLLRDLPRNDLGKVLRRELRRLADGRP